MARLTRKNIKVFAGSASNNGVFGSLQANNPVQTNDVEKIQSLQAWSEGWNSATETSEDLPPLEEFQGVQYVITYEQAYLMQEGLPEWASTVTYYKGSLIKEVTSTGFRIYCSLTDNNINNSISDTTNWKRVMDSDDLYAYQSDVTQLQTDVAAISYIGDIKSSVRSSNHGNWFLCNGQAISRTTYSVLFGIIGTTYGDGDGTTTFNIPDYTNLVIPSNTEINVYGSGPVRSSFGDEIFIDGHPSGGSGSRVLCTRDSHVGGPSFYVSSDPNNSGFTGGLKSYSHMNYFIRVK